MKNMKSLWYFLIQNRVAYGWLLVITISHSLLEGVNISLFFPLFKSILGQGENVNSFFRNIEKIITALPFGDKLVNACVVVGIVLILKETLAFTRQVLTIKDAAHVVCEVREILFRKYIDSDYQFFLDNKQGALYYDLITATGMLGSCLTYITEMIASLVMTLIVGVLLASISMPVTIFLAVIGIGFNLFSHMVSQKISYVLGRARAALGIDMSVKTNEFLDGVKYIKAFGSFEPWINGFVRAVRNIRAVVVKDALWGAIPINMMHLLPSLALIGMAVFFKIVYKGSTDHLLANMATIGVYAFAFLSLLPSLTSFGKTRLQILGALPDVDLVYNLLHEKTKSFEDGHITLDGFREEIKFENVSFRYKDRDPILKGITFTIPKGKTVAIVGSSGTGKSTLVNLLIKLFKPEGGTIKLDGVSIADIKRESLARIIGLVSQETFIFHGSINENILFGLKDVPVDKVKEAAMLANAHEFIMNMPQQYDTIIGDKGFRVSGGQRQRIAIARVVLRNPEILILDEATSSLDHSSEVAVQDAINEVSRNRTIIVIAHRLSTIARADKIIVLEHGKISEKGTHAELLSRGGAYKRLHDSHAILS